MDGIATSSFARRLPPPFQRSLSGVGSGPARERFLSLQVSQQSVTVRFSQNGEAFSGKVQEQSGRLAQVDPKLAEQYQAVIALLHHSNPEAARHFLDFMDKLLDNVEAPEVNSRAKGSALPEGAEVAVEVSAQVSEFVARVQGSEVAVSRQEAEISISVRGRAQSQKKVDPLVLDIDGDGVKTSGVDDGALFDLEATGKIARVSFVQGDDALLALDRNGNGAIDDGGELFGTQHGAANGFEELKKFDDNHDSVIDARDDVFSRLRGLRRRSSGFEIATLTQLGVQAISTVYRNQHQALGSGDEILQQGTFRRSNGGAGSAVDVGLSLRA